VYLFISCLFLLADSGGAGLTPTDRHSVPSSTGVTRHTSLTTGSNNATPASATASTSPTSLHTSSEQHDSFDDFDEDVIDAAPMQPIGTCVALYPFDGMLLILQVEVKVVFPCSDV